jgi:putative transposase
LEDENNQLKKLVAELSLDKQMLQDVIKKKALSPSQRRDISFWLIEQYQISVRRACRCMLLSSSMFYYRASEKNDEFLRMRIVEIAKTRIRYGFRRIFILLRREGFNDNHKRVYRIYKEEGLNLRTKRPRRNRAGAHRIERVENNDLNKVWSMDFVQDALFNGSRFRILSIVDNYSKKCLSLAVGKSMKGMGVVDQLEGIKLLDGLIPQRIQCDNGSEFISKEVDRWAYENGVTLDFSRPGKPTDNPYVKSFNGKSGMNAYL